MRAEQATCICQHEVSTKLYDLPLPLHGSYTLNPTSGKTPCEKLHVDIKPVVCFAWIPIVVFYYDGEGA